MMRMFLNKRSFVCSDFPEVTELDSLLVASLRIVQRYFYQAEVWTVKVHIGEVCFDDDQ